MSRQPLVLVIDDDPSVRLAVGELLKRLGFATIGAADGAAGLARLEREDVSLVVTDILMPRHEGMETILALRRTRPEIPVIAMTGGSLDLDGRELRKTAAELGAAATLAKPFTIAELRDAIAIALGES